MVVNEHFLRLKSGQKLDQDAMQSLENFVEAHPYSATLAAMHGKAQKTGGSANTDSAVRMAALLSGDRAQLHQFIFSEMPIVEENVVETPEETKSPKDPLEEQIISAAIGSGVVLDLLGTDEESSDSAEVSGVKEPQTKSDIVDDKPVSGPRSFSDWMLALANGEEEVKKVDSKELIARFIDNEEEVVPKRAEFFSPTKVAKKSTEDNEEIVSETLAQVYAAQGDLNKAISTYNKLSLLDPEKSSYFAGLIQKLKEEKKLKS